MRAKQREIHDVCASETSVSLFFNIPDNIFSISMTDEVYELILANWLFCKEERGKEGFLMPGVVFKQSRKPLACCGGIMDFLSL